MRLCYIVNLYPMPSHSFIRREIRALESLGASVQRIAFRGWEPLPADPADVEEQRRTSYTLRRGAAGLVLAFLRQAVRSPLRLLRAMRLSLRLGAASPRGLLKHGIYLAEACVVAARVRESGAEHIHAHFGTNGAEVAALASVLSGLPYSFTVHGPEEFDRPQALRLPLKAARAARVVAVSSYGRAQLYRWMPPAQWPKVGIVRCGVDESYTQGEWPAAPGSRAFVCVGRLCEQKGQLLLLEALHIVAARGMECEVVFAGDGPMRAELEERARALGLAPRIRITGWIDGAQVREELRRSRALVLPSFAEGLPVVIMEAMAMARPVISTYVAGIPELVVPDETGWLVPAGDAAPLAAAMIACLGAEDARLAAMGRAGRQRVLERHDVSREAAVLLSMFRAVRDERGESRA